MVKSKISVLAVSASLVATLGLCACGGQSANNANNAAPANTEATTETTTTEATTDAASSTSTDSQDNPIISWEGALEDGTLVSYMESDDGKNAAIAITPAGASEAKTWSGAETAPEDDKVTIVDDKTKETISFTLTSVTEDGAVTIDIEGYGKGVIVPFTKKDFEDMNAFQAAVEEGDAIVDWNGAFEDGTLVSFIESEDGTQAALSITPAGSSEAKRWMGAETDTGDNKVTITDDTTKESITLTLTKASADGTAEIEVEGYGKATIVPFTVNDYVVLESLKSAFTE